MLSLKFPTLEKLLSTDIGELPEDDPKRGICIKNNHAIVTMDQGILFFDLKDYFSKKYKFTDKDSLTELSAILKFMDGKMFSAIFWKELTSINLVSLTPEGIALDGMLRKDIYYQEKIFDQTSLKMLSESISKSNDTPKVVNAICLGPIVKMIAGMKPLIKDDTILFRSVGQNAPLQFTFAENEWIYGIVSIDPSVDSRSFVFDYLTEFCKTI